MLTKTKEMGFSKPAHPDTVFRIEDHFRIIVGGGIARLIPRNKEIQVPCETDAQLKRLIKGLGLK